MPRKENTKSANNVLLFIEERRPREFSELFAEMGRCIHPFHSGLFTPENIGRKGISNHINGLLETFDDIQVPMKEILPSEDSSLVLMRYKVKAHIRIGGGNYENDFLAIFRFDSERKISEWIDYYNPIQAVKAFDLMDKIG